MHELSVLHCSQEQVCGCGCKCGWYGGGSGRGCVFVSLCSSCRSLPLSCDGLLYSACGVEVEWTGKIEQAINSDLWRVTQCLTPHMMMMC